MKKDPKQLIIDNRAFLAFLAVFTATQLAIVALAWRNPLIWDSAVYAGMGKRLFSAWQYGIWEMFRPLALPVVLGSLWKAGMPLQGFPRILAVTISVTGLSAMHWMLKDLFDRKTALYSTLILMTGFVFYRYSHYVLTGIPSSFLVLTGVYKAHKGKELFSGFFTSIGFLTRFPAAIAAPGISIFLFFRELREDVSFKALKPPLKYSFAFFATTVPYFAFNQYMYGNAFRPLIQGATIPAMNPDKYFYGIFYLLEAVKSQPLFLFAVPGIYLVLRDREWSYGAFISAFITLYGFFTLYSHKEPRFMLLFLPLMAVFAAKGIVDLESRNFVSQKTFRSGLVVILTVVLVSSFSISYSQNQWTNDHRIEFMEEAGELNGIVGGNDPVVVLYGNFEFVPIRPENLEDTYGNVKGEADYYAFNSCAWYCTPAIENCESKLSNFTSELEESYNKRFSSQGQSCKYTIYGGR
jgi:4-amino-4-deoxy-L-arabinose transferase-like glycosyltransferase